MVIMPSMDVGERIQQARKSLGTHMRVTDLARTLGVSHQRVSNWEKGRNYPEMAMIDSLARALKVYPAWLLEGEGPMRDASVADQPLKGPRVRMIPIYGTLPAGPPAANDSQIIDYLPVAGIDGHPHAYGARVSGASMKDYLQPDDWAILAPMKVEANMIVHAWSSEGEVIKWYRWGDGRYELWSANPDFPPVGEHEYQVRSVCLGYHRRLADGSIETRIWPHGYRVENFRK